MSKPEWLSGYYCGLSADSCSSWYNVEICEINEYISKHKLQYKCGVIAWNDRFNEGKNIGEIAIMYGSNYSTVRKELEERGYNINDEEIWLSLLNNGKTLTEIAEIYCFSGSTSISNRLKKKFGDVTVKQLIKDKAFKYDEISKTWLRLYKEGWNLSEIANHYKVTKTTVRSYILK